MRHGLAVSSALFAALAVCPSLAAGARAPVDQALSDVALPGGLAAARTAMRDRTSPDRALFLTELIQRFYNTPRQTAQNDDPNLQALLAHLGRESADPAAPTDTIPLPLTVSWWTDVVFGGRATPHTLVLEILRSRDTALLYRALLALDEPTRTWIAGERPIVDRIVHGQAAALVHAAPAVRVNDGRFAVPGGERCRQAWEDLVGAKVTAPAVFLEHVLEVHDGMLAYFVGRMSRLPDPVVVATLGGDRAEPATQAESLRRLYRAFRRSGQGWHVAGRPFSSIPDDPSILLFELRVDGAGHLLLPGNQSFWTSVFEADDNPAALALSPDASSGPGLVDVSWLVEQVVRPGAVNGQQRTEQVLFASRWFADEVRGTPHDVAVTLAGLATYPALVRELERLRIAEAAVFRAAIERASALRAIASTATEARSTAQFQGALALVVRAGLRGSLAPGAIATLLTSLSAVPTSDAGDYDGRIAAWIDAHLRPDTAPVYVTGGGAAGAVPGLRDPDRIDDDLVALLTRFAPHPGSTFVWEGTRYRVDLAFAAARRLDRVRADGPRYLPVAWTLFQMADRLAPGSQPVPDLPRELASFQEATADLVTNEQADDGRPHTPLVAEAARAFAAARKGPTTSSLSVLSGTVRRLGDDVLARGLAALAYAAALGGADSLPIDAAEAASRHDFAFDRPDEPLGSIAWRPPVPSVRARGPWHVEGALLGLDVCLAESWLRRMSTQPLQVAPSMDRADRRVLSEVVTTMDPGTLTDADRDAIATALRAGRARLASITSAADLETIARTAALDPVRRSLLPWVFDRDRDRLASYLSATESFRLGVGGVPPRRFDAWGAPARPRLGCVCLRFPERPADTYMGYLSSGIIMGAFADLNLRLAERLSELHAPAVLMPDLLAAATLDIIDHAPSRYPDDLRSLVEQIRRVSLDDVERYLALLTTDGPLVPDDPTTRDSATGGQR